MSPGTPIFRVHFEDCHKIDLAAATVTDARKAALARHPGIVRKIKQVRDSKKHESGLWVDEGDAVTERQHCDRCQGNGEIVTNWDRYLHPLPGDVGDEAVSECPDCDGEGEIYSPDRYDAPAAEATP